MQDGDLSGRVESRRRESRDGAEGAGEQGSDTVHGGHSKLFMKVSDEIVQRVTLDDNDRSSQLSEYIWIYFIDRSSPGSLFQRNFRPEIS
jgi:hypothetical protein